MVSNSGTTIRSVPRLAVQRAAHQAHFLLQQQHFEQVAHGFGVADDVVAHRLAAKALAHDFGGLEDRQFALAWLAEYAAARATRRPRASFEQPQQQLALRHFVERA